MQRPFLAYVMNRTVGGAINMDMDPHTSGEGNSVCSRSS